MTNGNGDGKKQAAHQPMDFRNGVVLDLVQTQKDILAEMRGLRKDSKSLGAAIRRVERRLEGHLKAHAEDPQFMGVLPFVSRFSRRHWRLILGFLLLVLTVNAGLGLKRIIEFAVLKLLGG